MSYQRINSTSGYTSFLGKIWKSIIPDITIKRQIFNVPVYCSLRYSAWSLYHSVKNIETYEPFYIPKNKGIFWDMGCNIGVWSVYAATHGMDVIAFDISLSACELLMRTAKESKLSIIVRSYPLGCSEWTYSAPKGSSSSNKLQTGKTHSAVDYLTQAYYTGVPKMIKMDIEGSEKEFLESNQFKNWIIENKITFLVELHDNNEPWGEMETLDCARYIYKP